ncbi:hypothetical protein Csa_014151 [Cucumis sativus]|nr:hypothetical protein Csa_014151 [Cucumis sativus]
MLQVRRRPPRISLSRPILSITCCKFAVEHHDFYAIGIDDGHTRRLTFNIWIVAAVVDFIGVVDGKFAAGD